MKPLRADDPASVGEGRYRLVGRLGQGGMGVVYFGRSRSGRAVAVKVVRPELSTEPGFRRRFADEVAAARRVGGFHTAPVVDADPQGDPAWLVTAYVPGPTLQAVLDRVGPLPADTLTVLAAGLAEALAAIHQAGVIHRDLKPANIIVAEDGPRVIDFGIARALDGTALTQTGFQIGTLGFLAPEQLTGGRSHPRWTCSRWVWCSGRRRGVRLSVTGWRRRGRTASSTNSLISRTFPCSFATWSRPAWPRTRGTGPVRRSSSTG